MPSETSAIPAPASCRASLYWSTSEVSVVRDLSSSPSWRAAMPVRHCTDRFSRPWSTARVSSSISPSRYRSPRSRQKSHSAPSRSSTACWSTPSEWRSAAVMKLDSSSSQRSAASREAKPWPPKWLARVDIFPSTIRITESASCA